LSNLQILDRIGFKPDSSSISTRLKLDSLAGAVLPLGKMLEDSARIARPRAVYALFKPVVDGRDSVEIGGQMLSSRILRINLGEVTKVALFVATCGVELECWAEEFDDPLERWVADALCEEALFSANRALENALNGEIEGKYRVSMNPGSLEDWPLTEQGPLFRALALAGDIAGATGVELTESFLMRPRKSLSGVRFASSQPFANCLLCSRENCRGRRMLYDPERFGRLYDGAKHGTLYADSCGCGHEAAG
jgi:hypothetical protein